MSDGSGLEPAPTKSGYQPSPELVALDKEVRTRFARRTDRLESFLREWFRLDASQEKLFSTRGRRGENFLQYQLAAGQIDMALGIARVCQGFAETTYRESVEAFLHHADHDGNDLWHYLADNLRAQEDDDSLEIARILVGLDIDFSRKNANDESPFARLLIPTAKWQSVNSLLQAKTVTIDDLEASLPEHVLTNPELRAELVVGVLNSDLADNDGKLTRHLLAFATSTKSERSDRANLARALFDYAGGRRQETALMRIVETPDRDLLDESLNLLQKVVEDATAEAAVSDLQLAKANQQILTYRRLSRRNRVFQNLLFKAIQSDHPTYISAVMSALRNEELILVRRNSRGGTDREPLTVDKASPSPGNPALSLLLQQDARGNLAIHAAVQAGRAECLRKLLFGLSFIDTYVILTRIPNRVGLCVCDLLSVKDAHPKLAAEVKAKRMTLEEAQQLLSNIKYADKNVVELVTEILHRSEDSLARTGGVKATKPTFDLGKLPTIQLMLREGRPLPTR